MKVSYKYLFLLPLLLILVGCPETEQQTEEIRPYDQVYIQDALILEKFMNEHFMTVDGDYNVTYTKIDASHPGIPISSRTDLEFKTVNQHGINYKLYYIKLREGNGTTSYPTVTQRDSVFTSYKGYKTDLTSFDYAANPVWFSMDNLIQGWKEIFPLFKSADSFNNDVNTGTFTYNNFGAGVMFVPSGLAYYNSASGSIAPYTPLIFNFKIMQNKYRDHDGDKILSKDENGLTYTSVDTDGDGIQDYLDIDDDGDGKLTKREIQIPSSSPLQWYSFGSIPVCPTNNKKIHLTSSCN